MSKSLSHIARRTLGAPFCRIIALTLLVLSIASQLQAQNYRTLTSPSFIGLQNALIYSDTTTPLTIYCQFNGTLTVTSPLFITGYINLVASSNYDVTIAGSPGIRMFQVLSNATFVVQDLVISGGNSAGTNGTPGLAGTSSSKNNGNPGSVGGLGAGGAIYNAGTNYAVNCVFLTNSATGGVGGAGGAGFSGVGNGGGGSGGNGGAALGGAIYNIGTLILTNCTFGGNSAIGAAGGVGGAGGSGINTTYPGQGGTGGAGEGAGVYNLGRANIQACTFDFNFASGGNSQTAGGKPGGNGNGANGPNGASALGGGIYNSGTNLIIVNCTFNGNQVVGGSGGNGGEALNSTDRAGVGGNGGNGAGGGLYNEVGGTLTVTNCTFAYGSVLGGTNGGNGSVGYTNSGTGTVGVAAGANIANALGGTFLIKNSILAYPTNGVNAYGTFVDKGFNLSSDATPTSIAGTTRTNTDPLLLPFGTNGGPTFTFDLEPELSPALHAITDGLYPQYDQRGYPRLGPDADIGAVESGTPIFSLSGYLLPAASIYTNVVVNAIGTEGLTYTTFPDTTGFYSFSNTLPADTYTIVPEPTNGFSFNPLDYIVTLANTNPISLNNNFAATASYMIGGIISNLSSPASVFIYYTTNGNNTLFEQITTSNFGLYTFTNVPYGTFTIIPQQTTSTGFSPLSLTVNVVGNNTNLNFVAVLPTYGVSGQITGGTPPFLVNVNLGSSSTLFASAETDNSGNYSFGNLTASSYTIVPQPTSGLTFTPGNIFVTVPPSTNNQNFVVQGTPSYSISGQITNLHTVAPLSAISSSTNVTTSTDTGGNYSFAGLPAGIYTVTPGPLGGLTFSPVSKSVTVGPSATGAFFAAVPTTGPTNSSPRIANQIFDFSLGGFPNLTYRIQASTNLKTWLDISTNTTGTSGTITISNSMTGFSNRFFRAVTP